jgi:hypothetical protein
MLKPDPDGMPGEQICKGEVTVNDVKLPFVIEVTNKGNGWIKLANLNLHVYDAYEDTLFYDGDLLNVELVSLGEPANKYLVITGTAIHTDEKGESRVFESIVFIYRFDQTKKTFSCVYKHAGFDLEY